GFNWQKTLAKQNHNLTYGVQYRNMDYDLTSSQSDIETQHKGVFLQDDWRLKNDVVLGLGLRYDRHSMDMRFFNASDRDKSGTDDNSQLSPKLSVTKQLSSSEAVYASASSVFRPPTESDYNRWSGNYFVWANNPEKISNTLGIANLAEWQQRIGVLKPEHGMSYELGWKKQFGDKLGWRVTGFYNDINDYIAVYVSNAIRGFPPTYNIGNAKIKGVEISSDYTFNEHWKSVVTFTRQKGSKSGDPLDVNSTTLNNIPENTLNLGLRYQPNENFRAALDTRYIGRRAGVGFERSLGGHVLTDLSFMLKHHNLTYLFAVCNIFDKQYQESTGYPMPGTTYSVSCQLKF
ncbi:MAG: TonB-dependent receptor, partial [Sporomusaceae bacterium]|nr:TonB-dependent receptor [Sporomusaceae bacterium]